MKEQLIEFETAKLAKEKGLKLETYTAYIGDEFFESEDKPNGYDGWDLAESQNWNNNSVYAKDGGGCFGCKLDNKKWFEAYAVTSQSILQKWLREEYDIHIEIIPDREFWHTVMYPIVCINDVGHYGNHKTYEKALEKGLIEALKLIGNEQIQK